MKATQPSLHPSMCLSYQKVSMQEDACAD